MLYYIVTFRLGSVLKIEMCTMHNLYIALFLSSPHFLSLLLPLILLPFTLITHTSSPTLLLQLHRQLAETESQLKEDVNTEVGTLHIYFNSHYTSHYSLKLFLLHLLLFLVSHLHPCSCQHFQIRKYSSRCSQYDCLIY